MKVEGSMPLSEAYRRRELTGMRKTHDICKRGKKAVSKGPVPYDFICIAAWGIYAWGTYWADLHLSTDSCSPWVGAFFPFRGCLCFQLPCKECTSPLPWPRGMMVQRARLVSTCRMWGPTIWVQTPALLPTSSVTLGKGFHISEHHLPHP